MKHPSSQLVARDREVALLNAVYESGRAEFVALYGRRRVGKTFLIREYFAGRKCFYCEFTGEKDAPLEVQLTHFRKVLESSFYGGTPIPQLRSWDDAFSTLVNAMAAAIAAHKLERAVIFLDELPWMAAPRSRLIQALDHSWNTQFSRMREVVVVVCGSAASWMLDNLIHARGGLHNRITRQMRLMPFTLPEVGELLNRRGFKVTLQEVIELYMAIGGIPHYLDQLDKRLSVRQNVAALCFSKDGILRTEFTLLFRSLFGESDLYEKIVRALAAKRGGITRNELLDALQVESGGAINHRLTELEEAGFIAEIPPYGKRVKGSLYRIIDPYVYFYLSWIEQAPGAFLIGGEKYWLEKRRTPKYSSWAGYTFENICLTHVQWIQRVLHLDHVSFEVRSWCFSPEDGDTDQDGAQVDLVFDRDDQIVSLCEIKYHAEDFSIDKGYARELKHKIEIFQSITKTRKKIQLVMITLNGFKSNIWSTDLVDISLTADQIFDTWH